MATTITLIGYSSYLLDVTVRTKRSEPNLKSRRLIVTRKRRLSDFAKDHLDLAGLFGHPQSTKY